MVEGELSARKKLSAANPALSLDEKPPYSFRFHDDSIEELEESRNRSDNAKALLERAGEYAENMQNQLTESEAVWRLARDSYAKERTPQTIWELQDAAFQLEKSRAHKIASQIVKSNAETVLATRELELESQARRRVYIRDNLDLDEKRCEAQIASLNQSSQKLAAARAKARAGFVKAEESFRDAQIKYAAAKGTAKDLAQIERDMREADRTRLILELDHLQAQQLMLDARRRLWALRHEFAEEGGNAAGISRIADELNLEIRAFEADMGEVQKTLLDLQVNYASIREKLGEIPQAGAMADMLRRDGAVIQETINECLAHASSLFSIIAQERVMIEDLDQKYRILPSWRKALEWWRTKGAVMLNAELWQSGNYAVRLKEFAYALALILLGTWAARRIVIPAILWFATRRSGMDKTGSRSLSRILLFIATIGIFLGALRIVGIPLEAFAFLGGTLAIAIGFGAQNLFKNLIGGILLTVKRPFRIGSVIEVGGISGVVSDIGYSVTIIRTFDAKEVLIPNSDLLEKQVINWNLSDALLRCEVVVGVEYGTPAEQVRDALLAVADSNPEILKNPKPEVLLNEFADSSMEYILYFWVNLRVSKRLVVASDVRMLIQKKFAESGIEMAYPHMDVTMLGGDSKGNGASEIRTGEKTAPA